MTTAVLMGLLGGWLMPAVALIAADFGMSIAHDEPLHVRVLIPFAWPLAVAVWLSE